MSVSHTHLAGMSVRSQDTSLSAKPGRNTGQGAFQASPQRELRGRPHLSRSHRDLRTIEERQCPFAHRYLDAHPGDLVGLARVLGHSDLNTTGIYTQPTTDDLAARLERLPLNVYE